MVLHGFAMVLRTRKGSNSSFLGRGFEQKPYYEAFVPETLRRWHWRKQQLQRLIRGMVADIYCPSAPRNRPCPGRFRPFAGT